MTGFSRWATEELYWYPNQVLTPEAILSAWTAARKYVYGIRPRSLNLIAAQGACGMQARCTASRSRAMPTRANSMLCTELQTPRSHEALLRL